MIQKLKFKKLLNEYKSHKFELQMVREILKDGHIEFEVYYRTTIASDVDNPILEKNWVKFTTNSSSLDRSNYDDLSANDREGYKEYFFSKFDIQAFDQLQIKITMYSKLSNKVPKFANLRVLSTL